MKVADSFILQFLEDHYQEGRIVNYVSHFSMENTSRVVASSTRGYLLKRNVGAELAISGKMIETWYYLLDDKIYDEQQMRKIMKLKSFI